MLDATDLLRGQSRSLVDQHVTPRMPKPEHPYGNTPVHEYTSGHGCGAGRLWCSGVASLAHSSGWGGEIISHHYRELGVIRLGFCPSEEQFLDEFQ